MSDEPKNDGVLRCLVTGNPSGTDTWEVNHPCRCGPCQAYCRIEALERERDECRAKNTELNRRATRAEGAIREKAATSGPSLGRALANAGYSAEKARADDLEREVERLKGRLGQMCAYPLCECGGGKECMVVDGEPPEMCERSLLGESQVQAARLREALEPFAEFADPRGKMPADFVITPGSQMAKRQLTMGDCYNAAAALADSAPDPKAQAERRVIDAAMEYPSQGSTRLRVACEALAALREEE